MIRYIDLGVEAIEKRETCVATPSHDVEHFEVGNACCDLTRKPPRYYADLNAIRDGTQELRDHSGLYKWCAYEHLMTSTREMLDQPVAVASH
jgi:hypothetical protein